MARTKRAIDALTVERPGEKPQISPDTSRGLVRLASADSAINYLVGTLLLPAGSSPQHLLLLRGGMQRATLFPSRRLYGATGD